METMDFMIDETAAKLNTHEAVCALRYESICARIKRLEQILIGAVGFIIPFLAMIAFKLH